jgi:hypothetical protein
MYEIEKEKGKQEKGKRRKTGYTCMHTYSN